VDGPNITREALERYLNRRTDELKDMKRFLSEKKFSEIAMLSHKIKGSAPTFGLEEMAKIAEKIEESAEKSAEEEVATRVDELEQEVRKKWNP
jgi:HPt (histidine-containing phosphotransfer) domain-containing protein